MELIVVSVFFLFLLVASIAGRTVDSRDFADWRPSLDGVRQSRRP